MPTAVAVYKKMIGFVYVLLSSLLFGIEPTFRSLVFQMGASPAEVILFNSLIMMLFVALVCLAAKNDLRIGLKNALRLILLGGVGMWGTIMLLSSSYELIPVGVASVVHFMYPTLVCLTMIIAFKRKVTWAAILAMLLSVGGLVLICDGGNGLSLGGVALAFLSSITYTLYVVFTDKGRTGDVSVHVRLFYMFLGCLAASLISAPVLVTDLHDIGIKGYLGVALCSVMTFWGDYLFLAGVKRVGAAAAAFFCLLEPVTSLVFSTLWYGYSFSYVSVLGCAVSLAAIVFALIDDKKTTGKAT